MKPWPFLLAVPALLASCNFDEAIKRYCDNNPQCFADSGAASEVPAQAAEDVLTGQDGLIGQDDAETPGSPSIPPPANCGFGNNCSNPNEFCHPVARVCMQICKAPTDCPSYLDQCTDVVDPRSGSVVGPKVCSCSGLQACSSHGAGFVCNPPEMLCERPCATDQDCSGFQQARVCNQQTGWCQGAPPSCSANSDCPSAAQPRCDPMSQRCTGCKLGTDCAGRPDGFTQCSPTGSCVSPP